MSLRERINSDRKLQIGLGLVLVLVVALFMMKKGGGEEEGAVEEPVAGAVEEAPVGIEAAAATEGSLSAASAAVPTPPMPKKVMSAFEAGDIVGVLVVRNGGIDDKLVKRYTNLVKSNDGTVKGHDVSMSVVSVRKIARYGALTLGLDVQRVPAFIVLRPKSLSGGAVEGSVLYGYQTPASIRQALIDSAYKGPEGVYHPG